MQGKKYFMPPPLSPSDHDPALPASPPCRLHQTDAMQQHLGVTHISGRPVLLTLGLSTTSRVEILPSRNLHFTPLRPRPQQAEAAPSSGSAQGIRSFPLGRLAGMLAWSGPCFR